MKPGMKFFNVLAFIFLSSQVVASEGWMDSLPIYVKHEASTEWVDIYSQKSPGKNSPNISLPAAYGKYLPNQFRFADHQHLRKIIDQITIRLFESTAVKKSLCFLSAESAKDLQHFLGVSKSASRQITKSCRGMNVTDRDKRYLAVMKSTIFGSPTHQPGKTYVLFLFEDTFPKIEGYTNKDGVTFLAINQKEFNEAHLLRLVAHELAISFDQLAMLAPRYSTQPLETGLAHALGLPPGTKFEKSSSDRDLRCALADPAVRYGLAAERAFRFEDQVMKDLGLESQSPAVSMNSSCSKTVAQRAVQISSISDILDFEIETGSFRESCGVDLLHDALRTQTLVERIRLLSKTKIWATSGLLKKTPLCSIVLNPHVGPRSPENLRDGGPRPRIGGWD